MNDDPIGPLVTYGMAEFEAATFLRRCPTCGRMVKADERIEVDGNGQPAPVPNATCAKCGRVQMAFAGYL